MTSVTKNHSKWNTQLSGAMIASAAESADVCAAKEVEKQGSKSNRSPANSFQHVLDASKVPNQETC